MKVALLGILMSIYLLWIPIHGESQTPAIDSLIADVEAFYDTLDYSTMQTKNFFNRGFLAATPFQAWNDSVSMIFNFTHFDLYRIPIMRTDTILDIPDADSLRSFNEIFIMDEQVSTVVIPVMFMKGEFVRDSIIQLYHDSGATLSFEKFNFLCATPFAEYLTQGTVKYKFQPDLIYSNDVITTLEVDFDDGQGFRDVDIIQGEIIQIGYTSTGEKNLMFRIIDAENDTTLSYSYIDVFSLESLTSGAIYGEITDTTDTTMATFGSRSNSSLYANSGMDFLYYPGYDNKLNKPFIFVEGFDMMNSTDVFKSTKRMSSYIGQLQLAGYDVFITNFKDGRGNIYDNVNFMKAFIKSTLHGAPFTTQNYIENFEGTIFCLSMGGIISRIALKQLENDGYDHRIGTLITSDTPHKGANVAPFLQRGFKDLSNGIPAWFLPGSGWYYIFLWGDIGKNVYPFSLVDAAINSTAALQMVAQHNNPIGPILHNQLQTYLDQIGWPQQPRKVALVCGSNRGIDQGFNPGHKMIQGRIIVPPLIVFDFWGKASPVNQTNYKYWQLVKIQQLKIPIYSHGKRDFGDKPWCSAPGSKLIAIDYEWASKKITIPMMVPTLSAMDVKRSYFTGSNFYSYNRNNGYGKAYFIDNDITPFDDVYSVNVAGNENIQHPFVYQEAIIRDIILDQELMVTDYYLQNRTFDKDRDIECGGKMVVGSDVIPSKGYPFTGKKYLYDPAQYTSPNLNTTETEKSEKIAPVIVKSGYSLVLEAKDSIKLKPGFKAESGSTFKAIVDGTNPNTRSAKSEVRKCGRIISECKGKYSISNRDVSVNWILKGYNVHIEESGKSFSVPEKLSKGQYSLHATSAECPVASIVIVVEGKKEVYSSPESEYINIPDTGLFKIIPNPANESAKIVSWSKIGSYRITNSSGHLVLSNDVEFSLEHEINMSQFNTGVYLISVTYKNGEIETKSFVVQH